jgi:glucosamine 6-phosphate synthetase-like amidotransferase/phosphosugar isomerase protein
MGEREVGNLSNHNLDSEEEEKRPLPSPMGHSRVAGQSELEREHSHPKKPKQKKDRIIIEGRYILRKKICQGGFGKVYLA